MFAEKTIAIACIITAGIVIVVSIAVGVFVVNKDENFIRKWSKRVTIFQLLLQMVAIALFIRALLSMKGFLSG